MGPFRIVAGRIDAGVARIKQTGGSGWKDFRLDTRPERVDGHAAVEKISDGRVYLPANTIGQRQVRAELQLILRVSIVGLSSGVDDAAVALDVAVRNSQ